MSAPLEPSMVSRQATVVNEATGRCCATLVLQGPMPQGARFRRLLGVTTAVALEIGAAACSGDGGGLPWPRSASNGPLIAARTTMVTAWDVPANPLTDATLGDSRLSKEIRWGFKLFTNTPTEARRFTPSRMSCNNCHLNAGQREKSLPLVGVAGMFPEYNRRSGRLYSLADRIVDCFLRSENATGVIEPGVDLGATDEDHEVVPSPTSKEVLAIGAYITWLARGFRGRQEPHVARPELIAAGESDSGQHAGSTRRAKRSSRSGARRATASMVRVWPSGTRSPGRSGGRTRGMTAPGLRASTRWPASSGIRCRISIPAA